MKTTEQLFQSTQDAYSFSNYVLEEWLKCIKLLQEMSLSDEEIEGFLRSKHMRWAADNSDKDYGQNDLSTMSEYIDQNPKYVSKEHLMSLY